MSSEHSAPPTLRRGRYEICTFATTLGGLLYQDPSPASLCTLLDSGAVFEADATSLFCTDPSVPCIERLQFGAGDLTWSLGSAQDMGQYSCSDDRVSITRSLSLPQTWVYDPETWTLTLETGGNVLGLSVPAFTFEDAAAEAP